MKRRQPTALQIRVLEAAASGVHPLFRSADVHRAAQVASRAVNLCRRYGWLRFMARSGEYRLTAAGRKALLATRGGPS